MDKDLIIGCSYFFLRLGLIRIVISAHRKEFFEGVLSIGFFNNASGMGISKVSNLLAQPRKDKNSFLLEGHDGKH